MSSLARLSGFILLGLSCVLGAATGCQQPAQQADGDTDMTIGVEYVRTDSTTGTSRAAVVDETTPLAHTTQFFPYDQNGELVGSSDPAAQTRQVLENIEAALGEVDAGLENLVKLNVYASGGEAINAVKTVFADQLSDSAPPTVMYVETTFQNPDVEVTIDAVAAAPVSPDADGAPTSRSSAVYGGESIGHTSTLPPGERVYIAGQAERTESVVRSTTLTMESLHATLEYLGLDASDVVQVKGFMRPMSKADSVRNEIASFYPDRLAPSIVLTEWEHGSYPIEIEMIAAADTSIVPDTTMISYLTPPGMTESTVFSRVAQVHRGDPVYISGLYGDPSKDANGQIRDIFEEMDGLLTEAGSDFRHLSKATYYTTTDAAGDGLGEVRPDYYDPNRPPAASLSPAPGVGMEGAVITIDMIGVRVEE